MEAHAQPAIGDYGLIGDTRTTALVSRTGSIDWLCWPRHDSPASFLRLLDADKGGYCDIVVEDVRETSRRYVPGTNVLETTFVTATGRLTLTDFMPVNPPTALADEGPDGDAESRLVRIVACLEGRVVGRLRLRPTFDYAREPLRVELHRQQAYFCGAGASQMSAAGSDPFVADGEAAVAVPFALRAEECCHVVLTYGDPSDLPPLDDLGAAKVRMEQTVRYWSAWSARCTYQGPYREAVLRSALCLKLLTYSPTGGIVAAPTTSLPEATPGDRNFDYRFVWVRDASFTVLAFLNLGYVREAAEFLRFLRNADGTRGKDLAIMYPIEDGGLTEQRLDHLAGWRGMGPVLIGNEARLQKQHDIYGEFLIALHAYLVAVDFKPPAPLDEHLPDLIRNLANSVVVHRDDADNGLWEFRDRPEQVLHTKALLYVALDSSVKIARRLPGFRTEEINDWARSGNEVRADYEARGWDAARGSYTMAYDSPYLDAAFLRTILFEAFDIDDERVQQSIRTVVTALSCGADGTLTRRYIRPDGFSGEEGAFAVCTFWRAGCLAMSNRAEEAEDLFTRMLAYGNDLGLFAEEIDPESGALRGNFPQAFTHMGIINNAVRLAANAGRPDPAIGC